MTQNWWFSRALRQNGLRRKSALFCTEAIFGIPDFGVSGMDSIFHRLLENDPFLGPLLDPLLGPSGQYGQIALLHRGDY